MTKKAVKLKEGVEYFIRSCARCGNDHAAVFRKMESPAVFKDITIDMWATCPVNGEPILMGTIDDGKEESTPEIQD